MRTSALTHDLRRDLAAALTGRVPGAGAAADAIMHTFTLQLSNTQYRMLRQAAKYDGETPEDWIMDQLRADVVCCMTDCYGHREARARVGWDGFGEKPAKRYYAPRRELSDDELVFDDKTRANLERGARFSDTNLRTEYERLVAGGENAVLGFSLHLKTELDPFHGDLLRAFERRNNIPAADYACAVLEWHLREMYDLDWNGGEGEPGAARSIREHGSLNGQLTKEEVSERCRAAGLDPADYPDVGVDEGSGKEMVAIPFYSADDLKALPGMTWAEIEASRKAGQDEADSDFAAGRSHVGDPDDVALLAAAAPEPIKDLPPEQRKDSPPPAPRPAAAKPKGKRKQVKNGKEGK